MHKKYTFAIPAVIYAVVVFYLSSISSPPNPINPQWFESVIRVLRENGMEIIALPFYFGYRHPDKIAHVFLYSGFGLTLYPAVRYIAGKYPHTISIVLGTIYAVSDEFHQSLVPGRTLSFSDFLADFAGLLISQLVIIGIFRLRKRYFLKNRYDKYGGIID